MVMDETNSNFTNFLNTSEINGDPLSGIITSGNLHVESHWSKASSFKQGQYCKLCLQKVTKLSKILFIAEEGAIFN